MSPPFAYTFSYSYGQEHKTCQTLDKLVAWLKTSGYRPQELCNWDIDVSHEDGTDSTTTVASYIEQVPIDRVEVSAYIHDLVQKAKDAHIAEMAKPGGHIVTVTGSAPLYMLDPEDLINREVELRSWRWKGDAPLPPTLPSHFGGGVAIFEIKVGV